MVKNNIGFIFFAFVVITNFGLMAEQNLPFKNVVQNARIFQDGEEMRVCMTLNDENACLPPLLFLEVCQAGDVCPTTQKVVVTVEKIIAEQEKRLMSSFSCTANSCSLR